MNAPKIYKNYLVDKGIRDLSFSSNKISLYHVVNKNLPKDILSLRNVPPNSIYYKTLNNNDFLVIQ